MTEDEERINKLFIMVSTLANTQNICQENQLKLTEHVDKLVGDSQELSKALIRFEQRVDHLKALDRRIAKLEDNQKWGVRIAIGAIIAFLVKLVLEYNMYKGS